MASCSGDAGIYCIISIVLALVVILPVSVVTICCLCYRIQRKWKSGPEAIFAIWPAGQYRETSMKIRSQSENNTLRDATGQQSTTTLNAKDEEYINPGYAVTGLTKVPAELCESTSVNDPRDYDDIDKYFKSPNDEDYVNSEYDVSGKREDKQPQTNCNTPLPETSTTHPVDEKDLLSIESTEYESVVPRIDHIATTPDPVLETQENTCNLEHS